MDFLVGNIQPDIIRVHIKNLHTAHECMVRRTARHDFIVQLIKPHQVGCDMVLTTEMISDSIRRRKKVLCLHIFQVVAGGGDDVVYLANGIFSPG